MVSLLLVGLALAPVFTAAAVNPGAKIRLSQTGLNYGANVAVQILAKEVEKFPIPDVTGSTRVVVGRVEYEITNMKVGYTLIYYKYK